jgi:predicted DNA-binding protein (MmcQ/YjbR family)
VRPVPYLTPVQPISGRGPYVVAVDVDAMLEHCLAKPGAWPDNPWEHEHPVVKVGPGERGKIFAFLGAETVGVKSATTREVADEWLHRYPDDATVMPYIGRSGWNTLRMGGAIPDEDLLEAVAESYRLVVGGLPKKLRPEGWDS